MSDEILNLEQPGRPGTPTLDEGRPVLVDACLTTCVRSAVPGPGPVSYRDCKPWAGIPRYGGLDWRLLRPACHLLAWKASMGANAVPQSTTSWPGKPASQPASHHHCPFIPAPSPSPLSPGPASLAYDQLRDNCPSSPTPAPPALRLPPVPQLSHPLTGLGIGYRVGDTHPPQHLAVF